MLIENEDTQISKIEIVLIVGIIGCMLFATWELGHLMADEWFYAWVRQTEFTNRRIILYGIAFLMAIISVTTTISLTPKVNRFGHTVIRAFLWYGTILLISTIGIFVFDCLPEVFAGFIGAGVFIVTIYFLHKRFFTKERIIRTRINKGQCTNCSANLHNQSYFCPNCGKTVGKTCPNCNEFMKVFDKYCSICGKS
jgi:predicted RNA-binding Zn-ribbon protein involved in translation (DUF1610 family)